MKEKDLTIFKISKDENAMKRFYREKKRAKKKN